MDAAPLRVPVVGSPWSSDLVSWSDSRGQLSLSRPGSEDVSVKLERCAQGRLREAYPLHRHDIEVTVDGVADEVVLADVLRAVFDAVQAVEPECRRVIYAVPAPESEGETPGGISYLAAATRAGFRFVVEVDIADAELGLTVAEPKWATVTDIDLDHVPGT